MKFLLVAILLAGFIGIAVFGFMEMNRGDGHGMTRNDCIAAAVKGADCPANIGAFSLAVFHLEVFKNFTNAIFNNFDIFSVFLGLLILAVGFKSFFDINFRSLLFVYHPSLTALESSALFQKRKFTHWLALHENSPAFFWAPLR